MAGTLAHFLVMKKYLENKENRTVHFDNQDSNIATAFLGATGPDIFYVAGKSKDISDFHHYKNPGLFIKNLYESDATNELVKDFTKGFLSHMATDLVIHPFVNSLVGKYQEHIIKKVDIPGFDVISSNFNAHNMTEMSQDYYIFTHVFKKNSLWWDSIKHEVLFTYKIESKKDEIAKFFKAGVKKTYDIDMSEKDIIYGLNSFVNASIASLTPGTNYSKVNIEDYTDISLDNKYENYKIFLEHTDSISSSYEDSKSTFMELIDMAVDLTDKMVKEMESGSWDNIIKPWNLDTGLYTEAKFNEESQEIEINFNNYESVYSPEAIKATMEKKKKIIIQESIEPPKGYVRNEFLFKLKTKDKVSSVTLKFLDADFETELKKEDRVWVYKKEIQQDGTRKVEYIAKDSSGSILETIKDSFEVEKVILEHTIEPKKGCSKEEFKFTLKTEDSVSKVMLNFLDADFKAELKKEDGVWVYKKDIQQSGNRKVEFITADSSGKTMETVKDEFEVFSSCLTISQLTEIFPNADATTRENVLEVFNQYCQNFEINTPLRVAHFFAQVREEVGSSITFQSENLNYASTALVIFSYFRKNPNEAELYGRTRTHGANQEAIANRAYANRLGNGNIASGDGWNFRGKGFIQLTGRANYQSANNDIQTYAPNSGIDIIENPESILTIEGAMVSSMAYWIGHGLNDVVDAAGWNRENVDDITDVVNYYTESREDRKEHFDKMKEIFNTEG